MLDRWYFLLTPEYCRSSFAHSCNNNTCMINLQQAIGKNNPESPRWRGMVSKGHACHHQGQNGKSLSTYMYMSCMHENLSNTSPVLLQTNCQPCYFRTQRHNWTNKTFRRQSNVTFQSVVLLKKLQTLVIRVKTCGYWCIRVWWFFPFSSAERLKNWGN